MEAGEALENGGDELIWYVGTKYLYGVLGCTCRYQRVLIIGADRG